MRASLAPCTNRERWTCCCQHALCVNRFVCVNSIRQCLGVSASQLSHSSEDGPNMHKHQAGFCQHHAASLLLRPDRPQTLVRLQAWVRLAACAVPPATPQMQIQVHCLADKMTPIHNRPLAGQHLLPILLYTQCIPTTPPPCPLPLSACVRVLLRAVCSSLP